MPREPKVKSGEPLTRAFFNRILSEFASRIVAGTGITVRRSGNQVIIGMAAGARGGGGGTASIAYAQVVTVEDDYIACNFWNAKTQTAGAAVNVAKPYILRRIPFDGETITYADGSVISYVYDATTPWRKRVATDASAYTETQVVTPDYFVGEIIHCMGGATGLIDAGGGNIEMCDINSAGRAWARWRNP